MCIASKVKMNKMPKISACLARGPKKLNLNNDVDNRIIIMTCMFSILLIIFCFNEGNYQNSWRILNIVQV